jgi:hypothetical protein
MLGRFKTEVIYFFVCFWVDAGRLRETQVIGVLDVSSLRAPDPNYLRLPESTRIDPKTHKKIYNFGFEAPQHRQGAKKITKMNPKTGLET